jgi:hypothetical protein
VSTLPLLRRAPQAGVDVPLTVYESDPSEVAIAWRPGPLCFSAAYSASPYIPLSLMRNLLKFAGFENEPYLFFRGTRATRELLRR